MVYTDRDGVPWADEECAIAQKEYEAALGKFLVSFNRLENTISGLLEDVLRQKGLPTLATALANGESLSKKLELLKNASTDVSEQFQSSIPFDEIKRLLKERNDLAHGHFDINPHDASFTVVGKNERKDVDAKLFDALFRRSKDVLAKLRYSEAYLSFEVVNGEAL